MTMTLDKKIMDSKKIDFDAPIDSVRSLPTRAKTAFTKIGLRTMRDVVDYACVNDISKLRGMGKSTLRETQDVLRRQYACTNIIFDSGSRIADAFPGNSFHLFVEYCDEHGLKTISDLKDFDLASLFAIKGFGAGKKNGVAARCRELGIRVKDSEERGFYEEFTGAKASGNEQQQHIRPAIKKAGLSGSGEYREIHINPSNRELPLSVLQCVGINQARIDKLRALGIVTLGDLENAGADKVSECFRGSNERVFYDRISIFGKNIITVTNWCIGRIREQYRGRKPDHFRVYLERSTDKSLASIGDENGITRERVRQIEMKFSVIYGPVFSSLIDQHMDANGKRSVTEEEIRSLLLDDDCLRFVVYTLRMENAYEYLPFARMFVRKNGPDESVAGKLGEIAREVVGDCGMKTASAREEVTEKLGEKGIGFLDYEMFLDYLRSRDAWFYTGENGTRVFLTKQTYAKLSMVIIKEDARFRDGFVLYDHDSLEYLRKRVRSEFGDTVTVPENDRAASARLAAFLIQTGRGVGIHPDLFKCDMSVIDEVLAYIDSSDLRTHYFCELFNQFREKLAPYITDYNALHGIIAYHYRDRYQFTRDTISKLDDTLPSLKLPQRIESLILDRKRPVTRREIHDAIPGMSEPMIMHAIYDSPVLLQWSYMEVNTLSALSVSASDAKKLRAIVEEILSEYEGYCSDALAYSAVKKTMPGFVRKNRIEDDNSLFYLLQKLFSDTYRFRIPHICRPEAFGNTPSAEEIALRLVHAGDEFYLRDINELVKKLGWSDATAYAAFGRVDRHYTRVSEDVFVKNSLFRPDGKAIGSVTAWLNEKSAGRGFVAIRPDCDFSGLPDIGYEWNRFLLVSVIKRFVDGYVIVSPDPKDRRCCREVAVSRDSSFRTFSDITVGLLKEAGGSASAEEIAEIFTSAGLAKGNIPREFCSDRRVRESDGRFMLAET